MTDEKTAYKIKSADLKRDTGDKFFILADVHGFFDPMKRALDAQCFSEDDPHHKVVLLGDMFDRGPAAKETFAFFKKLGDRFYFIRGNHEDLLERCVDEFRLCRMPALGNFHNGTVDTIMQFCDLSFFNDCQWIYDAKDERRMMQLANRVERTMSPVLRFIDEKCLDYATLDDYVFVHGYVPCDCSKERYTPVEDWRVGNWYDSRWAHGTKAWHDGVRADGKTVVVGHWHTSEAQSLYHGKGTEWDEDADFSPFVDDGIIALDACTAYSGKCNCIVL